MINSYDLMYFIKVSETLNLREAAEHLGVSQPALSHSLKRLETELKTMLFLRRKKGLTLTSEGRLFLNKAKLVFQEMQGLQFIFQENYKTQFEVALGLHPAVAAYMMESLLQIKDLKIEYKFGLSREVTELVHQGFIDCALAINPTPHPELILRPILEDQFAAWKTKSCNEKTLFFDSRLFQAQELLRELNKKKFHFDKLIELPDLNLIAKMVGDGHGVGLLPERILSMATDKFLPFSDKIKTITDKLYLIYAIEKKNHQGIILLKDHLNSSRLSFPPQKAQF